MAFLWIYSISSSSNLSFWNHLAWDFCSYVAVLWGRFPRWWRLQKDSCWRPWSWTSLRPHVWHFFSSQMQIAIQHFLLQQTKVSSKKYLWPIKIRNSGVGTLTSRILQPHQWNKTPGSGGSLPQMKVWRVEAGPATSVFWGPAAFVKLIPRLGIGRNGTNLVHQPTSLVVHVAFQLMLIHFTNPGRLKMIQRGCMVKLQVCRHFSQQIWRCCSITWLKHLGWKA